MTQQRDSVIEDPAIPLEDKARAVFDAAGEALLQAGEYDPDESPVDYLKANARRLPDAAERARVIAEIDELARMYPPETNRYLAPNGEASKLNHAQWYAVRTPSFKQWFGDWERAARATAYEAGIGFEEAQVKLLAMLTDSGKSAVLQNRATGESVRLSKTSIGKLLSNTAVGKSVANGFTRGQHYAVAADIGTLFNNAIQIENRADKNGDPNVRIQRFAAPAFGENVAYITLKESVQHGKRIYTAELMEIKKLEGILDEVDSRKETTHIPSSSSILNILHDNQSVKPDSVSKIIDENGEPQPVYHGTNAQFDAFSLEKAGTRRDPGLLGKGFYFTTSKEAAALGESITLALFANAKNPLYLEMTRWDQDKGGIVSTALGLEGQKNSDEIRAKIIQSGYDAAILDYSPLEYKHKEIMLLNPEQIKSATDNAGTYGRNNPSILFQTAYHGTPNPEVIDRLNMNYPGTGEGGAMYGAGLYLTSSRKAGETYAKSERRFAYAGKNIKEGSPLMAAAELLWGWNGDKEGALDDARFMNNAAKVQAEIKRMDFSKLSYSGHLYSVELPDNENLADWDKPLQEQPKIWEKLKGLYFPALPDEYSDFINNGAILYSRAYDYLTHFITPQEVSKLIKSLDIPGHTYMGEYQNAGEGRDVANFVIYDDAVLGEPQLLFQTGGRDMVEEAADFDTWEEWRAYCENMFDEPMGKHANEIDPWATGEETSAWYKTFWEKSRKAARAENTTTEDGETAEGTKPTPAELDREFNEMIGEGGALEDFVEMVSAAYNENFDNWQAMDEEDEAERSRQMDAAYTLRQKLTHPTWESIFKAQGKMGPTQRKQLLTLIRHSPRDYRAIYAEVMERPDLAVSAEDRTAAILKYRITDSRKEGIDNLSPEKLRQLAGQLDIEDFAEKVRTGRAEFNDPIERAYIKQLQEQRKEVEETLKEAETDRQEDNEYLERMAGKQFMDTFNRALKAREEITRKNDKLDRAIALGQKNADRLTWQAQRAAANYQSIVSHLEALAKAQQLELNVREVLENQRIHDAVQAAKKELRTENREKINALKDEIKKVRGRERTKASLQKKFAVIMAVNDLKAYQRDLRERQETAKALTSAKRGVTKRILRPINPREVNADQGRAIAIIQRLAEPSMLEGIDRFIGGIEKPYLRTIFETWKTDEMIRAGLLKGRTQGSKEKMTRLFSKDSFNDLTGEERKYLYRKLPPKDWATALGLESIINRRKENFPGINGEAEMQIAFKHLPSDIYYRIMDKPFSEWTLEEGEELSKIIDDLTVQGKEIYKANLDAEKRRIREYQKAVRNTIRTVVKSGLQIGPGDNPEEKARKTAEVEKILGKYNEGAGGTAQSQARRRNFKGPLFGYADMNMYRFARMLDNGDTNGKNSAALYRRAGDAFNMEKAAVDSRTEKIQKRMSELTITESELWQKTVEIDLGGDLGKTTYTAADLIGFLSASRDEYSRDAVMYGNLLSELERGGYQHNGITHAELAPLLALAEGRYSQVMEAALKLVSETPKYQQLMEAIDDDFTEGGQRLNEALVRYNNTYMPIVEKYFPINRQAPVSAQTADAEYARDLMGASSGAFNVFVEKGFTNKRQEIPPQYQTAIKLDILGVWTEAVNKEERFIAYGQLVKDLNAIYKQNRQVKDAIQRRYGQQAVDYINKYINELANPNAEKVRSSLDNTIRMLRGNTAAAYLGWKASSIIKQFITSPAPFFAYMNPMEYWGTFIDYAIHQGDLWQEIIGLSAHVKHRSANLMIDMVKQQAKQQFDNKAIAAISKFNERGMKGLEWIDQMCVVPGWLVLYRKEHARLTRGNSDGTLVEKDIRVKAARYADDIIRLTQPSGRTEDLAPLFKGNTELGKAVLQFTASLNVIWQNIRYDLPQMIRDRQYKNAAGTIIGYALAGILLGAITAGFDEDDDETAKAKKLAWWATTQFTDAFPIIGSEATHLAELLITGKMRYQSGINLLPTGQKWSSAIGSAIKGVQEKDFEKLLKAAATAAEAAGMAKGLPVSGIKETGRVLGIGDGDGEMTINPWAVTGRR